MPLALANTCCWASPVVVVTVVAMSRALKLCRDRLVASSFGIFQIASDAVGVVIVTAAIIWQLIAGGS